MDFSALEAHVPEFIMKIYYILEKNEFSDVICWSSSGSEVHIKDPKALEDTVLPLYFRHKKVESFVRQLNMYRFNKVNKFSKEKAHLFFKNDLFRKGQIDTLCSIRRKKKSHQQEQPLKQPGSTEETLSEYKQFIKSNISEIQKQLGQLRKSHPYLMADLSKIHHFCNVLTGQDSALYSFVSTNEVLVSNNNFFKTFKEIVSSFNHFGSNCSIDMDMAE